MNNAIEMVNVSVETRTNTLLKNISFNLQKGEICGIYGRNGAGKSMLIKTICGLVSPTQGSIQVWGKTVGLNGKTATNTGILIESPGLLPDNTAFENLFYLSCIANKRGSADKENIRSTLSDLGINPNERKPVRKFSLGMRQKVALAIALFEKPDLLLLDEPTNNLDSQSISFLHAYLKKIHEQYGTSILLASHQEDDFNKLCSRVITIEQGKIVGDDQI